MLLYRTCQPCRPTNILIINSISFTERLYQFILMQHIQLDKRDKKNVLLDEESIWLPAFYERQINITHLMNCFIQVLTCYFYSVCNFLQSKNKKWISLVFCHQFFSTTWMYWHNLYIQCFIMFHSVFNKILILIKKNSGIDQLKEK